MHKPERVLTRTPPPLVAYKVRAAVAAAKDNDDDDKEERKKERKSRDDKKRKKEHRSRSKSRDRKKRKDKKHKKDRERGSDKRQQKHGKDKDGQQSSKDKDGKLAADDAGKEAPTPVVTETINVETWKKPRKNARLVADRKRSVLDEVNFEPDYSASDSESEDDRSTLLATKRAKIDDSVINVDPDPKPSKKRPKVSCFSETLNLLVARDCSLVSLSALDSGKNFLSFWHNCSECSSVSGIEKKKESSDESM